MKDAGELCIGNDTIDQMDECAFAIAYLRQFGLDIVFVETVSYSARPKGCYKWTGSYMDNLTGKWTALAYWNSHSTGAASNVGQPICKG